METNRLGSEFSQEVQVTEGVSRARAVDGLMNPGSVCVVGATERTGHGATAMRHAIASGFGGPLYPVNPGRQEVMGYRCYPELESLPEVPDCVLVAVRAEVAIEVLESAADIGVRSAIIFGGGFESGPEGTARRKRLEDLLERSDIALCGPNTLGVANLLDEVWLYAGPVSPRFGAGPVGLVLQSGSVSLAMLLSQRMRLGKVASVGNQAGLDIVDYFEHMIADPRIETVGLFVESLRRGGAFRRTLDKAQRVGKPVVICRPGRTSSSESAILAHTGALVGTFEAFEAVCRQHGAELVDDLDDFVESLVAFTDLSAPASGGLGVLNCSGGQNALILDAAADLGVEFPQFSTPTSDRLVQALPPFVQSRNPLDVTGALVFDADRYLDCMVAVRDDPKVSAVLVVHDLAGEPGGEYADASWPVVRAIGEAAELSDKPIAVLTTISGEVNPEFRAYLSDLSIPVLEGIAKGLKAVNSYLRWHERTGLLSTAEGRIGSGDVITSHDSAVAVDPEVPPTGILSEFESKRLLRAYGLPVVEDIQASTAEEAVAAAEATGYPVVLKADASNVAHKARIGGVVVGLMSGDQVRDAYESVIANVEDGAPDASLRGVLVQRQVPAGREIILGMKNDESFGVMLLVGKGGVSVESVRSFELRALPVGEFEIEDMIAQVWGRGAASLSDRERAALVESILAFSDFLNANSDWLQAVDINPLILSPYDVSCTIVDALIISKPS